MNKLKILIIDNSPAFTGAFKSIFQVTTKLISNIEFTYLIPKGSFNAELIQKANCKVLEYSFLEISNSIKSLFYLPQLIYNAFKLSNYIRKNCIDIVHVNDLYNMTGVLVKQLNPKLKLIYHIRLLPSSYAKRLYPIWKKIIEKYADKIICVSEAVAANFNKEKTTLIYDSIEIPADIPRSTIDSQKGLFTILYLANYIPGKGHKQAIEAYRKVLPDLKNTKLIFFGGTLKNEKNIRFKQSLILYTENIGLTDYTNFNGFSSTPEKEIAAADLMLNFSESESFSMTTLEALAYGTPIIATVCGGPGEIIENGISGILVPVNDIDAMATAIETLVNNKTLRDSFSQNGLKRVALKFDLDSQVSKLNNLYDRLLN